MLMLAGLLATSLLREGSGPVATIPLAMQGDVMEEPIYEITYENADVREVLKVLFKTVNANYSLASNVQGRVTLHLKRKLLDVVLKTTLNQVGAEYRVEKQVFVIEKKRKLGG